MKALSKTTCGIEDKSQGDRSDFEFITQMRAKTGLYEVESILNYSLTWEQHR